MRHASLPPPLMRGKLYSPRLAPSHVSRDRLVDQLTRGAHGPLTLVCAPAGSGKSVLVSEWLAGARVPHGWVSLDERDNERNVFLEYVLAAMHHGFPAMPLETRDLLNALTPPPLGTVVHSLSNDFDLLDQYFVLVLDDYHVITNEEIHELLMQLVQHAPARLHLIVTTRVDPPWPLPTLRVRGKLTELRASDLRFTAPESDALFQRALGGPLHQDVLSALHDESEGWAAGLRLMALVLHGQTPDQRRDMCLPHIAEDIGAYLLEEVLSQQAPHDQDRLLQMSILGRLSAALCEAVCVEDGNVPPQGGPSEAWGRDFLAYLDHANLFIVPLDAQHEFYRFHHLFQQFLAARLRERFSPDEIAGLHRRASAWFARHGFIEEALDHTLAAGDTLAAGQLVAGYRQVLYNHEQFARLARWLHLLPSEVKEHNPELLLAEARIAIMGWRYSEAALHLERAERELTMPGLEHPNSETLHGELLVLRGNLEFWDGNAERFMAGARYALDVLPADASHLRGLAHIGIAAGKYLHGDSLGAWAYLDHQLASHSPHLPAYAWLLECQGFLHWLDGDLTNLRDAARRLLRVSEDLELPDHVGLAHYFLGMVHHARNELDAAKQHLERAVTARFTMRLLWWSQAAGLLGLTYLALGEPAQARETLEDAHTFLLEQHAVRILPNMGAMQAEVNRLEHRMIEANRWTASVDPLPLTWALAVVDPRLIQARVYLSQERAAGLQQAAQLLAELRAFCERVPNRRLLMEVEALEALMDAQRGDRARALETLERVVRTAEIDGWVRLFVDLGPTMANLLTQLAAQGVAPIFIGHVLTAFAATPPAPLMSRQDAPVQLVEHLSEREVEVLTLLAQRLSNKEIAAHLFIAPATVKYHTINLYRKLNASDRREAVATARELGLVSMST